MHHNSVWMNYTTIVIKGNDWSTVVDMRNVLQIGEGQHGFYVVLKRQAETGMTSRRAANIHNSNFYVLDPVVSYWI